MTTLWEKSKLPRRIKEVLFKSSKKIQKLEVLQVDSTMRWTKSLKTRICVEQ